jgi:hypothetical protein
MTQCPLGNDLFMTARKFDNWPIPIDNWFQAATKYQFNVAVY